MTVLFRVRTRRDHCWVLGELKVALASMRATGASPQTWDVLALARELWISTITNPPVAGRLIPRYRVYRIWASLDTHRSADSVSYEEIAMDPTTGSTTDENMDDDRDGADVSLTNNADRTRRHFLTVATATIGALGAAIASWPFLASWRPSAKAQALGSPVQIDVSRLEPGEQATVVWRGKPVWILHRTPAMLERLTHEHWRERLRDPDSAVETQQPVYAQNATRSLRPEYFVTVALCTHLGCVPLFRPDPASKGLDEEWMGGYFCPCHGSKFDLAGRVTKNVPAPTNLVIPPHRYLRGDQLEIGVDHG